MLAADRATLLVDLTSEHVLTLTSETEAVLDEVDDEVEITVLLRSDDPGRVPAAALLGRYRRANPEVEGRVLDPRDVPGEAARLGVDPTTGGVAVRLGDEVEVVPDATEQQLTSALARLLRDDVSVVCATEGHGERPLRSPTPDGLGEAASMLEREGHRLQALDLLVDDEVPAECDVVLLADPATPMGPALGVLARWVADDGRLLVLADPGSDVDLGPLLDDVGLGVERGVVFEGDAEAVVAGDVTSPVVRRYSSASPVVRRLGPTYFPGVAEVTVDAERDDPGLTLARLADTSPLSYLERRPLSPSFDPGVDHQGPITVAAAADRSRVVGADVRRTRVVVVADADFASNAFVGTAANGRLLSQAVAWLTLDERFAALAPNLPADRPLALTDARVAYARFLSVLVVPGLFLVAGGLVWALRRRR